MHAGERCRAARSSAHFSPFLWIRGETVRVAPFAETAREANKDKTMKRFWYLSWAGWLGLVLLALVPVHQAVAEGDIYRCIYPDGQIEFRGIPVMGAECAHVGYRQSGSDEPAAASVPMAEERQPPVTESAEPVDPRVHNCEVARDNLEMLESGVPVLITGAGGEPALLSEDDRAERLRQARRDVDYWCGGEAAATR